MKRQHCASDNLRLAAKNKQDEFYTLYSAIEATLENFKPQFKDKVVYCNCDCAWSNFVRYFQDHYDELGLKGLLFSGLESDGTGTDFSSPEAIELLKQADVVVTNPPFSLFRKYTALLFQYNKKFLILGNMNALTFTDFFPHFYNNEVWMINNKESHHYVVSDDYEIRTKDFTIDENGKRVLHVPVARWFGNIENPITKPFLQLTKKYDPLLYPKYDNYDAIEVSKTADIPYDYNGMMGVPISFVDKYNPEQFEILGLTTRNSPLLTKLYEKHKQLCPDGSVSDSSGLIYRAAIEVEKPPKDKYCYLCDGKYYVQLYARILIRKRGD